MRIFNSAVEAVKEVERDLWEMGHKVKTKTYQDVNIEGKDEYQQKELVGYSFTLTDGRDWADVFMALGIKDSESCVNYVMNECQDRCYKAEYPLNPGVSWRQRKAVWEPFLSGGIFSYTYPARIFEGGTEGDWDTMEAVIHKSKEDPYSRQLIIPIFEVSDTASGVGRVPCTMYFQFLRRDPYFYMIHNMRSCDLYTHFALDMSISWLMLHFMVGRLGVTNCQNRLIMNFGSLHAFKKDLEPRGIF